jgi:hypothetical protein
MKSIFRLCIIYLKLFLLLGNALYFVPETVEQHATNKNNHDLIITKNVASSSFVLIKDNQEGLQKGQQHRESHDLFFVNDSSSATFLSLSLNKRTECKLAYRTPDYLLSSDLKSPPQTLFC